MRNRIANEAIRNKVAEHGIKLWEVADRIGVSAGTLTLWMRKELDGEHKEKVEAAIDALIAEE